MRLLNDRTAYVAVSRARYDALIYTDSTQNLSEALNREINKTTAVEAVQGNEREVKRERDKLTPDSLTSQQQRPSEHNLNQAPTHPKPTPTKAAKPEIEGPEIDLGGLIR